MTPWARLPLALALAAACSPPPAIPEQLGRLPRIRLETGEAARDLVARLHDGNAEVPADSAVAVYAAPDGEAALYLSTYPNGAEAEAALARMLAAIGRGGTPFSAPRPSGARPTVWRTSGAGREHALWAEGRRLAWLEADPGHLAPALADLLGRR